MTRSFQPLLLAFLCAACASEAPQPDPAEVEQLLASLEACAEPCPASGQVETAGLPDAGLPKNIEEKVQDADRLVTALEKVQPDKIDPSVAAALIAR